MRSFTSIFLCLFSLNFFGALNCRADSKDTLYIRQFERPYNIQINNWIDNYVFTRSMTQVPGAVPARLSPNLGYQSGVSLALKYITLSAGYQLPHSNNDIQTYGRTRYFNFMFSYYQKKYGVDVYYGSYRGLYLNPEYSNDDFHKYPDATLQLHGINIIRNFNPHRFSYRSSISLAECQRKSCGSFLTMLSLGYRGMQFPDNSLTPATHYAFGFAQIRPGYAYTFCAKDGLFFMMPSVFGGIGCSYMKAGNPFAEQICFEYGLHAKISAGFNGKRAFINVFGLVERTGTSYANNEFINQYAYFGINAGYRFRHLIPGVKWL